MLTTKCLLVSVFSLYPVHMRFKKPLEFIVVFLISIVWFAFFMPWNGFVDPDAFYHAKASALTWEHGAIVSFPWLDLTVLGKTFADQHFLFHVFSAPFSAVFGMQLGSRIASVLLAALCLATFYAVLRGLKLALPWFWTLLLAASAPMLFRLLLVKASPLAILLFLAGIYAAWRKKHVFLAGISALYVLSHGGFLFLWGSTILLAWGAWLYDVVIQNKKWLMALRGGYLASILACSLGIAVGLLLHPGRAHILEFLWYQAVVIGLGTPLDIINLGTEWYPPSFVNFVSSFALWMCLALSGLCALLVAPRRPLDQDRARFLIAFSWVLAVFVAFALKSRRNVEYLAPIIAVWCAILWSLIDARAALNILRQTMLKWRMRILVGIASIALGALVVRGGVQTWLNLHSAVYPDDVYTLTMAEISRRAMPGDRVFHSSWDEFPMLFALDERLRYVSGLDPTFLYAASSSLALAVRDATWENSTSTADERYRLITELDSRFIFASRKKHPKFVQALEKDPRYSQIADFPDSVGFELKKR